MRSSATLMVKRDPTGEALYAARTYQPGDTVFEFPQVEWRPRRDRHTVEHPSGAHLYHPILAKVSHSCDPNSLVVVSKRRLVAVRPISAGEAISFDYETTERWLARPFDCLCGSACCRGRIG